MVSASTDIIGRQDALTCRQLKEYKKGERYAERRQVWVSIIVVRTGTHESLDEDMKLVSSAIFLSMARSCVRSVVDILYVPRRTVAVVHRLSTGRLRRSIPFLAAKTAGSQRSQGWL
jgi:hypothetical protein